MKLKFDRIIIFYLRCKIEVDQLNSKRNSAKRKQILDSLLPLQEIDELVMNCSCTSHISKVVDINKRLPVHSTDHYVASASRLLHIKACITMIISKDTWMHLSLSSRSDWPWGTRMVGNWWMASCQWPSSMLTGLLGLLKLKKTNMLER